MEAIGGQIKRPVLGVGYLPSNYCSGMSLKQPEEYKLLPLFLVAHKNSMVISLLS